MPDRPLTRDTPEARGNRSVTDTYVILAIALVALFAAVFFLISTFTTNGDMNTTQQPSAQSQAMDEQSPATGETKTP